MKKTYRKVILRTMKSSLSRLAAIAGIVALGVGILAGLFVMPINMRRAMDTYFDRLNMYDLRIVSPLGLTKDDVALVRGDEGIEEVMPAYFTDVFTDAGEIKNTVTRIHSLPTGQLEALEPENYLNRVEVVTGRLPLQRGECVLVRSALTAEGPLSVGHTLTVSESNGDVGDVLRDTEYKIVGIVTTPYYCSVERESASIGNGTVGLKMYVPEECFSQEAYSEIFATVTGARALGRETEDYLSLVEGVGQRLADASGARCEARYDEVLRESTRALDEARLALAKAQREADEQLLDAQNALDEGREEVDAGERELTDAKEQIDRGQQALDEQIETLPDTLTQKQQELIDGKMALMDAEAKLAEGERELTQGREELERSRQRLETAREALNTARPLLAEAETRRDALGEQLPALQETAANAEAAYDAAAQSAQLPEREAAYSAAREATANAQTAYDAAQAAADGALDAYMAGAGYTKAEDGSYTQGEGEAAAHVSHDEAEALWTAADPGAAALLAARAEAARTLEAAQQAEAQARTAWETAALAVAPYRTARDSAQAQLTAAQTSYDTADATVTTLRAELEDAEKTVADGEAQLAAGEAQLAAGEKQLAEARRQVAEAQKQIAAGELQMSMAPDLARFQLEMAEKQLASARAQYESGLAAWSDGKAELEKGESEFARQKKNAQEQLAEAREKIEAGEEQLAELEVPSWYLFDLDDHVSGSTFLANVDRLEAITAVFPVFFFLVAALVALTTMTRMVEEERLQIGTLKALGYERSQIMFKYLLYAWAATALGGAAGALFGFTVIPTVIWNAYSTMYSIPDFRCLFDLPIAFVSVGAAILCTTLATVNACWQTLREWAAQLLLPKAPKAGKRIFLERIKPVWSRLKFTHKVTARNLLRYKKRFFMTVVGVAGCTALLVTGFGLRDSISDIVAKQFGDIFVYDFLVTLSDERALEKPGFRAQMEDAAQVRGYLPARQERTTVEANGEKCPVYLFVPADASQLDRFIDLHERKSGRDVALRADGVVITEKFAESLGLAVGDSLTVENSDGKKASLPVTGIAENYVENYIYLSPALYEDAYGAAPTPNSVVASVADETLLEDEALTSALLDVSGVAGVTWMRATSRGLDDTMESINLVVYVIILCAGALAFIVLYNLLNINITERTKEIATIKVLGFFEAEVNAYVARESNVLTLIGMLTGLVAGVFLHAFIMRTVEVDLVMFGRDIKPLSFAFSAALTAVFSVLVDLVLRRKLRRISMVESMKAPE